MFPLAERRQGAIERDNMTKFYCKITFFDNDTRKLFDMSLGSGVETPESATKEFIKAWNEARQSVQTKDVKEQAGHNRKG